MPFKGNNINSLNIYLYNKDSDIESPIEIKPNSDSTKKKKIFSIVI
jgi:hypothetical protein